MKCTILFRFKFQPHNGFEWVSIMPSKDWIIGDREIFIGDIIIRNWWGDVNRIYYFDSLGNVKKMIGRKVGESAKMQLRSFTFCYDRLICCTSARATSDCQCYTSTFCQTYYTDAVESNGGGSTSGGGTTGTTGGDYTPQCNMSGTRINSSPCVPNGYSTPEAWDDLNDSSNGPYDGSKVNIPSQVTLPGGEVVIVEFGPGANQPVATRVVDGLKSALSTANNNLGPTEKIKKIFISATTNGGHASTSNHYRALALDISRINGTKMITSGLTNQIKQLQFGLDMYPYIRENFGPMFKHKTVNNLRNNNYPVGGHTDHIHFSIQAQ